MRCRKLAFLGVLILGLAASLAAATWPASQPPTLFSPFELGSTWRTADGTEVKIEQVQGDWLRVTAALQPGFAPKAMWIYAPTGQVWRRF